MQLWARTDTQTHRVVCRIRNIKGRQAVDHIPCIRTSVLFLLLLITVLSTRVQERRMEDSRRILCGFRLPDVENSGFRNRSLEQTRK